jgi:hypothetical protein
VIELFYFAVTAEKDLTIVFGIAVEELKRGLHFIFYYALSGLKKVVYGFTGRTVS